MRVIPMLQKTFVKLQIALKQNVHLLVLIAAWFVINFIVLVTVVPDLQQDLLYLFFISTLGTPYGHFYFQYGQFVIFGLLIGLVTVDAFRNYDPKQTCKILAKKLKNHAIVFGYDHLGIRLADYLKKKHVPHVIVSRSHADLSELYEKEMPAIVYNELDEDFVAKVQMKRAKFVFLLEDDNVLNLKLAMLTKKSNPKAILAVRCFDDAFSKIFHVDFGASVISSSFSSAKDIMANYIPAGTTGVAIIGFNHLAERVANGTLGLGIQTTIIEHEPAAVQSMQEFASRLDSDRVMWLSVIEGKPLDFNVLQDAGVLNASVILITMETNDVLLLAKYIREMNPDATVIARTFSDEMGKVLEGFKCVALSTSANALHSQLIPLLDGDRKS
jgi:Trk K+ transport system NAD-binding subunit